MNAWDQVEAQFAICRIASPAILLPAFAVMACSQESGLAGDEGNALASVETVSNACLNQSAKIAIAGGIFTMGSEAHYREETPLREVRVEPFIISATEVTNAQFAEFVAATGYVTQAERQPNPTLHPDISPELLRPGSAVFFPTPAPRDMNWWRFVEGASWKTPDGPDSDWSDRAHHPVTHVTYADAMAYAQWAGGDLPTEEEWEFAARGGRDQATYEWGEEAPTTGKAKANTWQGVFPISNTANDGYANTAPVGCFAPNDYGLHDMTGNVWEWTKGAANPGNPNSGLVKGGSYLCADNYCARFRPAAKQAQERDFSTSHIGFRVVFR